MIILRALVLVFWSNGLSSDYCLEQRTMETFCYYCCFGPRIPGSCTAAVVVSWCCWESSSGMQNPSALKIRPSIQCRCYTGRLFGCSWEGGSLHMPKELSRSEDIPASAMNWEWESVFLLTFKNDSLSVFEKCHSWLSCCFLGELISTPGPPHQRSEVGGRERRCHQGGIYCAFAPQGQGSLPITPRTHHLQSFWASMSLSLTLPCP